MSDPHNVNRPKDLWECIIMLATLNEIEGGKLANRDTLRGCIQFLTDYRLEASR